jgi:RNA polymerase sigma-70 factor (ECF subfamily)
MNPRPDTPDWLERYRSYLHLLARLELRDARVRLEASDLVQQTLMEAYQQLERFRGQTSAEQAAWLRQILANNLADGLRAQHRQRRDVRREQSIEQSLGASSARLAGWIVAEQSSPSARVASDEDAVLLASALTQLPEAQREALVLQHWQGMTLAQIGERLGKTPVAVAGLLKRGLARLRELLQDSHT